MNMMSNKIAMLQLLLLLAVCFSSLDSTQWDPGTLA